jgi:hypothetical protein
MFGLPLQVGRIPAQQRDHQGSGPKKSSNSLLVMMLGTGRKQDGSAWYIPAGREDTSTTKRSPGHFIVIY